MLVAPLFTLSSESGRRTLAREALRAYEQRVLPSGRAGVLGSFIATHRSDFASQMPLLCYSRSLVPDHTTRQLH